MKYIWKWLVVWILVGIFMFTLGAMIGRDANATPVLQINCKVAKIGSFDPIVDPPQGEAHRHVFFGNKDVDKDSTLSSLRREGRTNCNEFYDTSSYWVPSVRDGSGPLEAYIMAIYYSGPGDQSEVIPIPQGLQMIGTREDYRCGEGNSKVVDDPPYGCKAERFRIRVHFPNCWNGKGKGPNSLVYSTMLQCPWNYPHRIPTIRMAVHYKNTNAIQPPLLVSAGDGHFKDSTFMHGDVFNAGQQPYFDNAIQRCVIRADEDNLNDDTCRP